MFRPISHTVHRTLLLSTIVPIFSLFGCTGRSFDLHTSPRLGIVESANAVDINSADSTTLQSLPDVGAALAERIIQHRDRYGPFRRIEHLLLIDGISENRFQKMRPHLRAD